MEHNSAFIKSSDSIEGFPELRNDIETDVVIIGGGITGLTTAYLLNQAGIPSVLLEGLKIGSGTTGYSSAHLTTDIDIKYHNLFESFGEKIMRLVGESRIEGINLIENIINRHSISCDFERVNGYYFIEKRKNFEFLRNEFQYARNALFNIHYSFSTPLPYNSYSSIKFPNQAQFNPQKFLNGIAEYLRNSNCLIFENTRAINQTKKDEQIFIETQFGKVKAKNVVMATHVPLFMNVMNSMVAPYRSYIIAAKLKDNNYPDGLFWDAHTPYHYFRTFDNGEGKLLIAGGMDHKSGHSENTIECYEKLEAYIRERFDVESIEYQWSAEYFEPADGLPYIGRSPFMENVFIATGYSGDGLVYGPIAARIISDLIISTENRWAKAYDSGRFTPVASFHNFIKENVDNAKQFVKDRISNDENSTIDDLLPGEGIVKEINGEKVAISKDMNSEIHSVSAVCTHLKCIVHWNNAEQSWDCPCHGSQFSNTGEVLYGPAVQPLTKKEIKQPSIENKKLK